MTWTAETSKGRESDKIAHLVIPYTRGKGLDIGCGVAKVWPHCIGIDSCVDFEGQRPVAVDIVGNGTDLALFADDSLDFVFSSHFLEHVTHYRLALAEWWRVIKPGGHLVLYLPHRKFYPNMGEPGANPDHKHDFLPEDIISAMKELSSWDLLENEERDKYNEYSFFQVYRKRDYGAGTLARSHRTLLWQRHPEGKKRALVIRYGAIGDQIVASSILPLLQRDGWHVTYNTTPDGMEIIKHDPHVDEFLLQDKDQVPNVQLGPYWESVRERYDLVVNLCESVEGALLALPGRLQHAYPAEARRRVMGTVNYLERTHDLAGLPHKFNPRFYPSEREKKWAMAIRKQMPGPVIAWAINGSSPHKVYPWTQVVAAWLLERTPAHIVLLADPGIGVDLQTSIVDKLTEQGVEVARLHPMAGKWSIREALTFVQSVDCVVGPETGTLNAVCMEDVPKVIYLSHSSPTNLTKHWRNTTVLVPDALRAPCWPCHQLHSTWEHCHQDKQTFAALCASGIAPEEVFEAVALALGAEKSVAAA